jgi:membrane protein implicated in regulation of membrane protease activity
LGTKVKALATLLILASILTAALMGTISLVTEDWRAQFAVFSVLAVVSGLVSLWRWWRQRHHRKRLLLGRSLVGRIAEVRQTIPIGQRGDILVDGRLWVASSAAHRELKRGEKVRIVQVDGALLLVEPVAEQKPPTLGGVEGQI